MTQMDALNLIRQGLACLMESNRQRKNELIAVKCSLDGTANDCELIVSFVQETERNEAGVQRNRSHFVETADEIDGDEEIETKTNDDLEPK